MNDLKKRYNLINDSLGWLSFIIAAITYLLTIEPTASFWDCPEFITQGAKLEVGHPPGNPIFMLTARFFVTIFGGDMATAGLAVNVMSALLSAATILLLFWSVTHLARRLIVKRGEEPGIYQTVIIMAAGLCGALAYTWSDTFWFSAVESEVYAFSSFCTALVFWLILKWENRADSPHSDRYLILIAYVIGVSIAVHLLNLLCIPAIALVIYYRKAKETNVKWSLITLALSFVVIALILYGLVPGYISVAQVFELLFVNGFGCGYNTGVAVYFFIALGMFVWAAYAFYRQRSTIGMKISFFLAITFSGMPFIGSNLLIGIVLLLGLAGYFIFSSKLPVRILNLVVMSVFVIFIGYSSYALLLVRSNAGVPMNQNKPDNVFALSSYLNREQYGERPLVKGNAFAEELVIQDYEGQKIVMVDDDGTPLTQIVDQYVRDTDGMPFATYDKTMTKVVKTSADQPDQYVDSINSLSYRQNPDLSMWFTRIFSTDSRSGHPEAYKSWAEYRTPDLDEIPANVKQRWAQQGAALLSDVLPYIHNQEEIATHITQDGTPVHTKSVWKPGFLTNLKYFLNYQLNHMYWRYFMWNFAGRQNDIQGNGEPHLGNWISGIPLIDNMRLGDQSQLPDEYGKGNKGHNVFYMLPLLLGVIGLLWQSFGARNAKTGIEQFWVIFFLFFMTGIAIVLYLNQTPGQPRERDYAFAGSFYAFAIWIGLGVPAIAAGIRALFKGSRKGEWVAACVACIAALGVPLQMVSQTWDDHDRSNRYTTRDFGANYLYSLEPNAIIFTNGDNDTFPLWYAQEVEGVRTDVKVVNLSYLTTDWYAELLGYPTYEASPVDMYAKPQDYAYERLGYSFVIPGDDATVPVPVKQSLMELYRSNASRYGDRSNASRYGAPYLTHPLVYVESDSAKTMEVFNANSSPEMAEALSMSFSPIATDLTKQGQGLNQSKVLSLDIIANSAENNWQRPVYFATTVPGSYYMKLDDYMYSTGMTMQVTPFYNSPLSPVADKAYENIVTNYRFGGLDNPATNKGLYLDETVRRMVSSTRSALIKTGADLLAMGNIPATEAAKEYARANNLPEPADHYDMARHIYMLIIEKMPADVVSFDGLHSYYLAEDLVSLYEATGNMDDLKFAREILEKDLMRYGQLLKYASTLSPSRRAALGHNDTYSLQYPGLMVGLLNRIDLLEAARNNPDVYMNMDMTLVDGSFTPFMPNALYPTLYITGITEDDVESAKSDPSEKVRKVYSAGGEMLKLHKALGVDPQKWTEKVLEANGLTRQEWINIIY